MFAMTPLHNLELPGRQNVVKIGPFRIVKVRPYRYRRSQAPTKVVRIMREDRRLANWVHVFQKGYYSNRQETPRYVLYYFPESRKANQWLKDPDLAFEEIDSTFDGFLLTLRIHKQQYVSIRGARGLTWMRSDDALKTIYDEEQKPVDTPSVPVLYEPRHLPASEEPYKIYSADVHELEALSEKIGIAFETKLGMAFRRYLASNEKELSDRLIDLLVTLEILYGDRDRSALGHKIAFRCATIVGATSSERKKIFGLAKKAYGERSNILHGNVASQKWVAENINQIEELVRKSLLWFASKTAELGNPPNGHDVDEICFQSVPVQS